MSALSKALTASTSVTFPSGAVTGRSKVLHAIRRAADAKVVLFLKETPFHPIDRNWPDQPADKGFLQCLGRRLSVMDCEILGVHKETEEIRESKEIPKREKENWHFVVAHIIDSEEFSPESFIGEEIEAEIDMEYRSQLNFHHTACHLAAFALNFTTKDFWRKDVSEKDSLGSPNLDQIAMSSSFIYTDRSEDTYRFGKSIRKKGLNTDALFEDLNQIQDKVNELLQQWIEERSGVEIIAEGPKLDDKRVWRCQLLNQRAEVPCGGTHISNISLFERIHYQLQETEGKKGERRLLATTTAYPKNE